MSQPATTSQQAAAVPATVTQQAVEVFGKGIYHDLGALTDAFQKAQSRFNVCFPVMKPDLIPPLYSVALRPVAIDARLDQAGKPVSGDLYKERGGDKYALTKVALDKLAAAANVSWHPAYTGRVDDRSEMHFRTYRACGMVLGLDGTPRLITKHKSLDLRDGAPHGMKSDELDQARKHIDALCESKAMNRVVRTIAHIKSTYTAEELRRPFVIAALVFTGETDDPELKREVAKALVQRSTNASAMLFGPPPGASTSPDAPAGTPALVAPPPLGSDPDDGDEHGDAGAAKEGELF